MIQTFQADFSADPTNVAPARNAVARFAAACGFEVPCVEEIRLAAGEAIGNAVEHGCCPPSGRFFIECAFDGKEFSIEVRDSGAGFAPAKDGQVFAPDERGRGFGISIMRRLMDSVTFAGPGNCVRLVRRNTPAGA